MCLPAFMKLTIKRGDVLDEVSSTTGIWDHPFPLLAQYQLPKGDVPPIHVRDPMVRCHCLKTVSGQHNNPGAMRHTRIYIPGLPPRPLKYRSFLEWLRVMTCLLDYKSKRTIYLPCSSPHTRKQKITVQRLNGEGTCAFSL